MKSPTEFHLQLAYKVLAHIISTKHQGLNFKFNVPISLNASADASYASHSDRKSHLGITLHIGDNNAAFYSASKKSSLISLSSTEAEYCALFECTKLVMWARQFLIRTRLPTNRTHSYPTRQPINPFDCIQW